MDIIARAKYVMENAMCANPEKTEAGYRIYFTISPFPDPKAEHMQWDDGDGTARGLDAWLYLREMTGDRLTGKEVEEGQWEYLQGRIHPQTGLVYVADLSFPHREGYYYHMWDQGRTLRHLVNRYIMGSHTEEEKKHTAMMIDKMIQSLKFLGTEKILDDNEPALYWAHDHYVDSMPIQNDRDWVVCNGQLLEPVTKYAQATGSSSLLIWAIKLANGFIAGLEINRWESTSPMFGEQGEFFGHFHCIASGLAGLAFLAGVLIQSGMRKKGNTYLDVAMRAYKWIFSEQNANRGGSHGWFPEQISPNGISRMSEICGTADMVEFTVALASISKLGEEYSYLDRFWDAADRFTRNYLCRMQILHPEKLERWIDPEYARDQEKVRTIYNKIRGAWGVGQAWPHDLMDFETETGSYDKKRVLVWGCCFYSGPRGLYSCWSHAVEKSDGLIDICLPIKYEDEAIRICDRSSGGIVFTLMKSQRVTIRVPGTVDPGSARLFSGGDEIHVLYDGKTNRIELDAKPGLEYEVKWDPLYWESDETMGLPNNGHVQNVLSGVKIKYHLKYWGNTLVHITPDEGAFLPYLDGL